MAYKLIQVFTPSETKIEFLVDKFMNEPLYLTDEYRSPQMVRQMLSHYLYGSRSMFYELGAYDGIIGFVDIIPGYKCNLIFEIWNKDIWGATACRELKDFSSDFMKWFKLRRISTFTPDERMAKLGKLCGFKVEGKQKYGFRWNGEMFTNILLRKIL